MERSEEVGIEGKRPRRRGGRTALQPGEQTLPEGHIFILIEHMFCVNNGISRFEKQNLPPSEATPLIGGGVFWCVDFINAFARDGVVFRNSHFKRNFIHGKSKGICYFLSHEKPFVCHLWSIHTPSVCPYHRTIVEYGYLKFCNDRPGKIWNPQPDTPSHFRGIQTIKKTVVHFATYPITFLALVDTRLILP